MRISRELLDEIVAHAREEVPNECCGIVAGVDGRATRVHRARNAEASPFRYVIDSRDQLRIVGEIEERGEEMAAIYHSHTKSEPYPSQTDINLADAWPDPLYLICSLARADDPEVRAFVIRDGRVEEAALEIEGG
jgi:proteasome lid subunit RPN8/RPN11